MNLFGTPVDITLMLGLAILCGIAIGYGLSVAFREPAEPKPEPEPEDPYDIHTEIDQMIDEMQKRGC